MKDRLELLTEMIGAAQPKPYDGDAFMQGYERCAQVVARWRSMTEAPQYAPAEPLIMGEASCMEAS